MAATLITPTHIAIVLILLLLILGPKRLPRTGRALGSAIREFKDAITGHHQRPTADTPTRATAAADLKRPTQQDPAPKIPSR